MSSIQDLLDQSDLSQQQNYVSSLNPLCNNRNDLEVEWRWKWIARLDTSSLLSPATPLHSTVANRPYQPFGGRQTAMTASS